MRFVAYLLVGIHIILFLWGIGGAIELIFRNVPWSTLFNPDFPMWLLPFHFGILLFASTGFLYGYFTKWVQTPNFMILGYGLLTILCIIETFWFMTNSSRYIALLAELIAYSSILYLLFKTEYFDQYFELNKKTV